MMQLTLEVEETIIIMIILHHKHYDRGAVFWIDWRRNPSKRSLFCEN